MNALAKILDTIILPSEITQFEHNYVKRINRIGLFFYWAHLPLFVLIAYFNNTNPIDALVLTPVILAGPTYAFYRVSNQRTVATIYGITAMLTGGLLVHFGQGPVQIEMHFYFFAMLAMLAVYANPMVIVAAAVTVAVHHLLLWMYLPQSVFNYEAPFWVVGVHAGFVVAESVATCSIARGFFDNVIGLERIVQARTAQLDQRNKDMRLVLDYVDQALLTIDAAGKISPEYSRATERWFGRPNPEQTFGDLLSQHAPDAAVSFEMGWEQIQDDLLPLEVCIDQLPSTVAFDGRHLALKYRPIHDDQDRLERMLIVVKDNSAEVARERLEAEQNEILRVFQQILRDKSGFLEFFDEAETIVTALRNNEVQDLRIFKRVVHTLKGNAAIFSIRSVADVCHELETFVEESGDLPPPAALEPLLSSWGTLKTSLETLLGDEDRQRIEIDDEEFAALLSAVLAGEDREKLAERIASWRLEPTSLRLQRLAQQAEGIAQRLEKPNVAIEVDGDHMLEPKRWSRFWQTFVHALRNALDHGIESQEERAQSGKDPNGKVSIRTAVAEDSFVVEIEDDGRGVDWETVRDKAHRHGFQIDNTADLKAALFKDGFTTRDHASQYSGRGVGMAALREASEALGGQVVVESEQGSGTLVRFVFPKDAMAPEPHQMVAHDPESVSRQTA